MMNSATIKEVEAPAVEDDTRADWQKRILSDAEAGNLAEDLFGVAGVMPYSKEADELAAVVIKIICLFADETDAVVRESNSNFLGNQIYARTESFCYASDSFAARAQLGLGRKAAE